MGNCLVTKLKGTVDNDNLKYFGQLTITLMPSTAYDDLHSAEITVGNDSNVKYKAIGNITGLRLEGVGIPLEGTLQPNRNQKFQWLGEGTLIVYSRYNITRIGLNTGAKIVNENKNEIYDEYAPSIKKCIFVPGLYDSLDHDITYNFYWSYINVPQITDGDYSHVIIGEDALTHNIQLGFDDANLDMLHNSDINGYLTIKNLSDYYDKVTRLSSWNNDNVISNVDAFRVFTNLENFAPHGCRVLAGDAVETLKCFTKLRSFAGANNEVTWRIEWKPVFDAWKAAGKVSETVEMWASGTYNGDYIMGGGKNIVTFDASGNYTVAKG